MTETVESVTIQVTKDEPSRALFNENNPNWAEHMEYNSMFLKMKLSHLQYRLLQDGYIFLNDVLTELGLQRTMWGAVAGWVVTDTHRGIDYETNWTTEGIEITFRTMGVILSTLE